MKEYLLTLLAVCIVTGIVRVMAFDGALAGYVQTVCAVCVLTCMIIPVFKLLSDDFDIGDIFEGVDTGQEQYGDIFSSYLLEQDVMSAQISLSRMLENELSLKEGSVDVELSVINEGGQTSICGAVVTLYADAVMADPKLLKEYIMQYTGVECEIVYKLM